MKSPNAKNRSIQIEPAFRWIALGADAETAEFAQYIHKDFERKGKLTRERTLKMIGASRTQVIVQLALDLGHALFVEATKPDWFFVEKGEPDLKKSLERAANADDTVFGSVAMRLREVALERGASPDALIAQAREVIRIAKNLDYNNFTSDIVDGIILYGSGDLDDSSKTFERIASTANVPAIREIAVLNGVAVLHFANDLDRAGRFSDMAASSSNAIVNFGLRLNQYVLAADMTDRKSIEILGDLLMNQVRVELDNRCQQSLRGRLIALRERLINSPTFDTIIIKAVERTLSNW